MVEQEWMKFASTGSVQDYLSYRCRLGEDFGEAGRETMGRSVNRYGTEHSADGHGDICNSDRGV